MKNNPLHLDMMPTLETFPGVKIITIESQTEKKLPGLFTNKLISLLELGKERATGESENKVQLVPKNQDEKVIALHHDKLGSKLTRFKAKQRSTPPPP
ncbi:hypothetical protein MRB53_024555 [Persea americana]|uniref:Uncharacterized protein n=1 Tax=Persea americana TaxID=3435 RepID=A0ACC2LDP1_PERAE|nr:hypothetical protein MRB53_024555 [Persea americana]